MASTNNTAELEALLVGPYRWSSSTYCSFIVTAFNIINAKLTQAYAEVPTKPGKSKQNANGSLSYNEELVQFIQTLITESNLVLGEKSWVDILEPDLWDLLKLDDKGRDRYKIDDITEKTSALKRKSIVELMTLIRDKIIHLNQDKEKIKKKLPQFFDKDRHGEHYFNENKFVKLFVLKFPKLMPYLWIQFEKYKDKLYHYYPRNGIGNGQILDSLLDLNKLAKELQTALLTDLENGNLLKRFKGEKTSLEFRGYHSKMNIKDDNVVMQFVGNAKDNISLPVSNSLTRMDELKYIGSEPGTETFILLFLNQFEDKEVWKYLSARDCRVIVLCDPSKLDIEVIEKAVDQFRGGREFLENPLRGNELSLEKQDWIYEQGHVCIQNKNIKLKDMFSNKSTMAGALSGALLNKLLKNETVTLCADYDYPEYKGVYIERQLYFPKSSEDETVSAQINVALTSTYGELNDKIQVFRNADHLFNDKDSVSPDCELILLEEPEVFTSEIVAKCDAALCPRLVRIVRLCGTCIPSSVNFPRYEDAFLDETEFLKVIRSRNIKTVMFIAESGMGKSKLLQHLGEKMKNSCVIFCSFKYFLDLLRKRLHKEECSKIHIISVIKEILSCRDESESNIVQEWLERQCDYECTARATIDLQLDGLDEVPSENMELALKALAIIKNELHTISTWVTSTESFPIEGKVFELEFIEISILPFTKNDKVQFFFKCWQNKYSDLGDYLYSCIIHFLKCLTFRSGQNVSKTFTNSPLNCSMLAELYEDEITDHNTLSIIVSGVELYESLVQKKFACMLRKLGYNLEESDNYFNFQRETFLQLHSYLALVHKYPHSSKFMEPPAMRMLTVENYCKMRIITSTKPHTFIHKTFADFFVARFIIKVLETGEVDNLCSIETFHNILYLGSIDTERLPESICDFINEYLRKLTDWNTLKWLTTRRESPNSTFELSKMNQFLRISLDYRKWYLAKLLINLWVDPTNTVLCNEVLSIAIHGGAPSKLIFSMCNQLQYDNDYELLISLVENGRYDIAKLFIKKLIQNGDEVFDRIAEMRKGEGGILHCIASRIEVNYEWSTPGPFKVQPIYLTTRFYPKHTKDFIKFLHIYNKKEILRKNAHGVNFLEALSALKAREDLWIPPHEILLIQEFAEGIRTRTVSISYLKYLSLFYG